MPLIEKYFDFGPGKVFCLDFVDPNKTLNDQLSVLREDMGWVNYWDGAFTIDYGWTPDQEINGTFKIYLIKDHNWDEPYRKYETSDIQGLISSIGKAIDIIKEETNNFEQPPPTPPPFDWPVT